MCDYTNLLDRLRRKYKRMLILHAYTILDPDAHISELRRPSIRVGDVDSAGKELIQVEYKESRPGTLTVRS